MNAAASDLAARRRARVTWLRDQLAALPRPCEGDTIDARIAARRAYDRAIDNLQMRLMALPDEPRFRITWQGARVEMLGITSTSTAGPAAALTNWIARAEGLEDAFERARQS